jgi:hypothetical protein
LIADYLRGPEKVATLVAPLAEALLNFRPAPDRWSIHEILRHLVDFELVTAVRMRKILAEERPALPPFDQNAWASRLHYLDAPVAAEHAGSAPPARGQRRDPGSPERGRVVREAVTRSAGRSPCAR